MAKGPYLPAPREDCQGEHVTIDVAFTADDTSQCRYCNAAVLPSGNVSKRKKASLDSYRRRADS